MTTLTATRVLSAPDYGIRHRPTLIRMAGGQIAAATAADQADDRLLMPALVNAHDHGYGIRTLAVGAADDALECWIQGLANRPETDPYLEAAVAFGRMAQSGIGTTVHCHNSLRRDRIAAEAQAVAAAQRTVGIRVAFSCPVTDRNPIVYGDHHHLPPLGYPAELIRDADNAAAPDGAEQVANAIEIASELGSDCFNVQFGPIGPQWCRDATLEKIAQASAETGMRVHMHLLETERQRQWLDSAYPEGIVSRLDKIGLLSERLTVAHGVWLTEAECVLLASRGVTVAVNNSSNLRLRSGRAPVGRFAAAGLRHCIGLDGGAFDDDQDQFREIRLFRHLHRAPVLEDTFPAQRLLQAALADGYRVFDGSDDYGTIAVGARADLGVIDFPRLNYDQVSDGTPEEELLIGRATARDVTDLYVNGKAVMRARSLTGFDFAAAETELIAAARHASAATADSLDGLYKRREAIRSYYNRGLHRR